MGEPQQKDDGGITAVKQINRTGEQRLEERDKIFPKWLQTPLEETHFGQVV
jgi:hypothetical protein